MDQIIIDGRYKVIKKLSEGGFGETFVTEDSKNPNRQQYVIKKLRPQSDDEELVALARRLFTQET